MHLKKEEIRIALLIPAYNEERHIKGVIESSSKYGMDIIIIDDGSIDSTASVVESLVPVYDPLLKLISHTQNLGKGQALITGFDYIKNNGYTGVITLDADGQHDTREIIDFLGVIGRTDPDLVIGNRLGNTAGMPFIRLATNIFTSWIISKIAGKKISDVQSGYRYLKTDALKKIKLKTKNFDTEPEIILRAGWLGMDILNVPIKTIYHDDFISHVNPVKDTIKFFKLVLNSLKWRREFRKQSYHSSN
ncbi:MAG: glycosyltransferase family 2 protein [Actinobacteria bacterium]|nr:glycosyltransferase family 2 protein [Actinomycetota bacterium]